jgi:hypothetical protein
VIELLCKLISICIALNDFLKFHILLPIRGFCSEFLQFWWFMRLVLNFQIFWGWFINDVYKKLFLNRILNILLEKLFFICQTALYPPYVGHHSQMTPYGHLSWSLNIQKHSSCPKRLLNLIKTQIIPSNHAEIANQHILFTTKSH